MTESDKHGYQVRWLAERLYSLGQRPYIGDCLQCGPYDGTHDCADCWVEASAKVAEAAVGMPDTWAGEVPDAVPVTPRTMPPAIEFTRLKPRQWYKPQRDDFAITRKGWLCWTWPNMSLLDWQNDARSVNCIGRIMQDLGSAPGGTHTFWPCENRDVFWSGLMELGVRVLCVIGETAASRVGLPEDEFRPLHWEFRNGVVVATLWSFEQMMEAPGRAQDCATFLKAMLRQLRISL
ncbi:MAG: hypothetical protein K6E40_14260 [Desulfovibrio sp.]|nr:hypothetical protein [Desulfovibrio sp.]